jgi:hypothetical protein
MTCEVVVDSSAFLGMHSDDEEIRSSCKAFFARRMPYEVWMSLEQIGRCDDIVWRHSRAVQDAYYPFMDTLHTEMTIHRVGYEERDVDIALTNPGLINLPMRERLLIGMVLRRDAVLYTVNPRLRDRHDLPVATVPAAGKEQFLGHLEQLYQISLALRLPLDEL